MKYFAKPLFSVLLLFIGISSLQSQDIITNGFFSSNLNSWYLGGTSQYCNYQFIPADSGNILLIEVYEQPVNLWDIQLLQDYQTGTGYNDVRFLEFKLKNPESKVTVAVQDNGSPWHKYVWIDFPPSPVTTHHRIAFEGSLYQWNPGEVELCFFMGYNTGTIELSEITFKNLGPDASIDSLNATMIFHKYFGDQQVDNSWTEPAQQRIDSLRKSPLTVICRNQYGDVIEDATVRFRQLEKDFPFGVAVHAPRFGGSNYDPIYVNKVGELFNMVTIENRLKWSFYQWAHPAIDYVFEWAENQNIPVHGHCLFWPSYIHCPDWLQGLEPQETYDSVISHVEQYGTEFQGKVLHWDVLNEAVTNNEIWQYTGINVLADAFIMARAADSTVFLMYNDYNVLINDTVKQQEVMDLVTQLIQMGAPIEGLGIQGHIKYPNLVTPANAIKNLDRMSELGLPIYITELDISVEDHYEFQAGYFGDMLTALYSHPSVEGIIQWGFWEGSHWRPEAALYNYDWTPRPAGLVFEELILETWETDTSLLSGFTGLVSTSCFNGQLAIDGEYEGIFAYDSIQVKPFSNDTIELIFDITNFFVDGTSGNDDNPGTLTQPWQTIQKAFNSATPGSTVFIREGIYNEEIVANVSGNETAGFITFCIYEDEQVILDGTGLPEKKLLDISGRQYLRIQGLEFRNAIGNYSIGILIADGSDQIRIIGNIIHDIHFSSDPNAPASPNKNSQPLIVYGDHTNDSCTNILIEGNEISNCRTGRSEGLAVNGNVSGFIIEGNHIHDLKNIGIDAIGHEGTCSNPAFDQARNGIISWNRVHHCASDYATAAGIYVDGAKDIVIENNISVNNQYGIEVGCENSGKSASNIIVRNNLVYKNANCGIAFGGYDFPSGSGKVADSYLSGNTCFWNDTTSTWTGELYLSYSENCNLTNNIFYSNANNFFIELDANPIGLELDHNLWYCPDGQENAEFYWNGTDIYGFSQYQAETGQDEHSVFGHPDFVNSVSLPYDFYLQSDSPAIDAGDHNFVSSPDEKDLNGMPRINNIVVDAGAYEFYGVRASQLLDITNGWSGISTFVTPVENQMELLTDQISDQLVVIKDMQSVYWPGGNIHTLQNWDTFSGYAIKLNGPGQLEISGFIPESRDVELNAGWNIIPVLNENPVEISGLFSGVLNQVVLIKEVAGTGLYWPEVNIITIDSLSPGKAYYVLVDGPCLISY
nr:endo-1,4-beta-xylanase [Bacteroidota bacterium]